MGSGCRGTSEGGGVPRTRVPRDVLCPRRPSDAMPAEEAMDYEI